jgi:multidrug resistance efflux pump
MRYGKEGNAPKRIKFSIRFSRYLYLALLTFVAGYGILYAYRKLFIVEGVGIIQLQSLEIRAEDDMRLTSVFVDEGDDVLRQQMLVRAVSLSEKTAPRFSITDKRTAEIQKITQSLNLKNLNLRHLQRELKYTRQEKERLEKLGTLEWNVKRDIIQVQRKEASLASEIQKIQGEIRLLRNDLNDDENSLVFNGNSGRRVFEIASPVQAQVLRILKQEDEIALKGETLITLSARTDISIKGFFELDEIDKVRPGRHVEIVFPDKRTAMGRISRFYYSTLPLPEEFQNSWEPTKRQLVVDIQPLHPEAKSWIHLHRVPVRLRIY